MITIIGAGPGGSYCAYKLAKAGREVQVIEEHPEVGKPVACTGIITGILSPEFEPPENIIVNKIKQARIYAPSGEYVSVNLKSDVILNRDELDKHIAKMAQDAGASYVLNHRFIDAKRDGEGWELRILDKLNNEEKKIHTDILIGADGPHSRVAHATGLFKKRTLYAGMQVTIKQENEGYIQFYPIGKAIAWLVPENNKVARCGIATMDDPKELFDKFMKNACGEDYESRITDRQAGMIPLYEPKAQIEDKNLYLVGDAATTVKAPTLGGINQSILGGKILADCILNNKNYTKELRKEMGKDLKLSLWMRKIMDRFSAKDFNQLVSIFQKEKNKKILEKFDRDQPSKFAIKLALQEPKLVLFARKLI